MTKRWMGVWCALGIAFGAVSDGGWAEPERPTSAIDRADRELHPEPGRRARNDEISTAQLDRIIRELTPLSHRLPRADRFDGPAGPSAWVLLSTAYSLRIARETGAVKKTALARAALHEAAYQFEHGGDPFSYADIGTYRGLLVRTGTVRPGEIALWAGFRWRDDPDLVRRDAAGEFYIREDLVRQWLGKKAPAVPTLRDPHIRLRFLQVKALPQAEISVDEYRSDIQTLVLRVPALDALDPAPGA